MRVTEAIGRHPLPLLDLANRRVFVEYMLFAHALMIASVPLIEDVLRCEMPDALRLFYVDHLDEERGHAQWLAEDLATLGARPALDWNAAQIAGTQYYLVRHAPPEVLLGYMAAIECRPPAMPLVESLEAIYGKEALRTMRHHAQADLEHAADLLGVIESMGEPEIIVANAGLTASMLTRSIEQIPERVRACLE